MSSINQTLEKLVKQEGYMKTYYQKTKLLLRQNN